jgi:hypothetical protein
MKNVPPAPRKPSKRLSTLAGFSTATYRSSQMRVVTTSMPPSDAARESSGAARASAGEDPTTPRMPFAPSASTTASTPSSLKLFGFFPAPALFAYLSPVARPVASSTTTSSTRHPPKTFRPYFVTSRSASGAIRLDATVPFAIQRTSNESWCASA